MRDYFDVNLTQKSYYPALKFASYVLKYYSEVNECHVLFFDLFNERFFVLSKNDDYTQSQEMVFFIQFIEFFDDFGALCDMLSEIKIFDQINALLENNKISHNVMNLIITMMDKTGRVILNGKFTDNSLFDIYIRESFEDEIAGFINLIQKKYDNMNIFAKRISFTIFSKLLDNSHTANVVISEYNYDSLNDILQSAPKDMIIIAIDFLSECINKTVKISQGAFEELLDKLDESEVPSIFDELAESDDQDVSERAKMIIDRIKFYTQDDDD